MRKVPIKAHIHLYFCLICILSLLPLAGCTSNEQGEQARQEWEELKNQQVLQVEFQTLPDSPVPVGEPVQLLAKVTYGDELVTDAEEVLFEIWKKEDEQEEENSHSHHQESEHGQDHMNNMDGVDTGDMLSYESQHEGVYSLETTFEEPGTYYVMYHVTAKGQHNMKPVEVHVQE